MRQKSAWIRLHGSPMKRAPDGHWINPVSSDPMRSQNALLAALVALPLFTISGCKKDPPTPAPAPSSSAATTMDTHFLDDEAKRVLGEIATLETTKDVT